MDHDIGVNYDRGVKIRVVENDRQVEHDRSSEEQNMRRVVGHDKSQVMTENQAMSCKQQKHWM